MPSPFPGMDPYLESPTIWPDVHHNLMSECQAALNGVLRPRYVARVELRVYVSDDEDPGRAVLVPDLRVEQRSRGKSGRKPKTRTLPAPRIVPTLLDEEVEEAYLTILTADSRNLVTVLEILSPANKVRGSRGRASFLAKRREVLESDVHWVEIDLLRSGTPSVTDPPLEPSDYRILVSRADQRTRTRFWPVSVRAPLPVIGIPLRGKEPEALLDLGAVLRAGYDRAAYDLSVDYSVSPRPPLEGEDAVWAADLLAPRKG